MHQHRILTAFLATAAGFAISSCSFSSTAPSDPPTLMGDWWLVDSDTLQAEDNQTFLWTETKHATFKKDGSFVIRSTVSYEPQTASRENYEYDEQGTWKVSGDTLVGSPSMPGLGDGVDSTRFRLTSTTLTLTPFPHPNWGPCIWTITSTFPSVWRRE